MKKVDLKDLGLNESYIEESKNYDEGLFLGRVSVQHRNMYNIITENGEIKAEASGKFKYEVTDLEGFPAVGDWVLVDRDNDINGNAIIHHLLKRKSFFKRKVSGDRTGSQVVGANIDTIFICMSLNNDFNLRRLERYIAVAFDSMATPVIVLTKSDLCDNIDEKLIEINNVAIGIEIIVTSSASEDGYNEIKSYLKKGKTIALIGSSGVGKSTMINKLLGEEKIKTNEISENDKGKHTTTYRQLFLIETGGVLIDTPGMRELGLIGADIEKSFVDIEELVLKCKFSDCRHENEKGCAVREAIKNGTLTEERLRNYKKLQRELIYNELSSSKALEREKIINMFGSMSNMKQLTRHIKNKKRY